MLDFRIQTFLSVCRHMNFTHAAEELHITQPAVSQHIRFLEQLYGVSLFLREGKKIILTPAGEILQSTMTVLRNDECAMVERMRHCGAGKGVLRFGVTMTIGEYVITTPLAQYLKKHPEMDVHIQYGNTSALLHSLHEGKIDFALVEGYFQSEEYDWIVYRTERYIPVCASGHAFTKPVKTLRDLLPERLLVREEGSGTRDVLEKNLAVRNIRISDFSHIVEAENMHTIVSLLVQDCGVAFLYQAAVRQELEGGLLRQIPLVDFDMEHDFTFLWNKGSAFSVYYAKVCRELKEYGVRF